MEICMYQHSFNNQKGFKSQHNVHKNLNGNCLANFGTNNRKGPSINNVGNFSGLLTHPLSPLPCRQFFSPIRLEFWPIFDPSPQPYPIADVVYGWLQSLMTVKAKDRNSTAQYTVNDLSLLILSVVKLV